MAYPFFSWYPHQLSFGSNLETIDLTEDLSDLQVTPKRDVVDVFSLHGGRSRELLRPWIDVRITLDRFTDRLLFRKFTAMINHLERGGSIAFGVDSAKVWAARTEMTHYQDATTLIHGANVAGRWHATSCTALATGDELVIESGPPLAKREYHRVDSVSTTSTGAGVINIGDSMNLFDEYRAGSLVRYSDFYPTLILPPGGVGSGMLTHDHRITYTLDLTLVYIIPMDNEDDNDGPGDGDNPDHDTGGAAG